MALEKADLDAIHDRKTQDFEESIAGGVRLARFESVLGNVGVGVITVGIMLSIVIYFYSGAGATLSRAFAVWAVIIAAAIGVIAVLVIKKRILGWLRQLLSDTFEARRQADEDYSHRV